MAQYDELRRIIHGAGEGGTVFFGGAGVSTGSGIPDFRGSGGLYGGKTAAGLSPEEILSHGYFMRHTGEFYDFYRERMLYPSAKPNAAHLALAKLERDGYLSAVVTQNIDGLHTAAGSRNVFELHGSVLRNSCMDCGRHYGIERILSSGGVPRCDGCGGVIKPDVVLYGEQLDEGELEGAAAAVASASVLIVGGTSLTVNPAAWLVRGFRGRYLVIINKSPTPYDGMAQSVIREPVGEVLSAVAGEDGSRSAERG